MATACKPLQLDHRVKRQYWCLVDENATVEQLPRLTNPNGWHLSYRGEGLYIIWNLLLCVTLATKLAKIAQWIYRNCIWCGTPIYTLWFSCQEANQLVANCCYIVKPGFLLLSLQILNFLRPILSSYKATNFANTFSDGLTVHRENAHRWKYVRPILQWILSALKSRTFCGQQLVSRAENSLPFVYKNPPLKAHLERHKRIHL